MCNVLKESDMQLLESGEPGFDLQKEYDDANTKYFGGELKPVKLIYKKMSGKFGMVRAAVRRRRKVVSEAEIKYLAINSIYKYTREQFLSTFLHEMCHVKMLQNASAYSWYGGYHGGEWQELANYISKESGISVTESESSAGYKYLKELEPYVVIMRQTPGKDYMGVAYTSMNIWIRRGRGWEYSFNPDLYVTVFKTTDERPIAYAAKSTTKMSFYKMPLDEAMDVLKNKRMNVLYAHKPGEAPDSRSKQVVRALQGEGGIKLTRIYHHLIENTVDLSQVWYRGTSSKPTSRSITDHHGYGWYFISDIERAKKYGEIIKRYKLVGGDILNGKMTSAQVGKILTYMKQKNIGSNIQHVFENPDIDLFDDPQEFYYWLVWRDFIGDKKTATEFLKDSGIDGMVTVNDVGDEILVVYNPKVMQEIV